MPAKDEIRSRILEADDLPIETVECPEWGLSLKVRTLSGTERDEWENRVIAARAGKGLDLRGIKIMLVQLTVVDDDGQQVFTPADRAALNGKSSRAIDRLFQVAQRLSGLTNDDVQEMVGNSGGGLSADSG